MITRLLALLRSPYPQLCQRWKGVLYSSLIIFLILYLFQPFGISRIPEHKLLIVIGYGLMSSLSLSVFAYLLPALFPNYYKEETWTLGRDLLDTLLMCMLIALSNAIYSIFIFHWEFNRNLILGSFLSVIILAPFPIVFFQLLNRNILLSRNLKEATKLNILLAGEEHDEKDIPADLSSDHSEDRVDDSENTSSYLSFADGSKDVFELEVQNLLYAEAEGNYIKLVYLEGNKVMQKLLRMTMKQAEGIVRSHSCILRCHRAYLVNIHFVARVDGNMQGYRLRLKHCSEEVPVSRAYTKQFKIHLNNIAK